MNRMRISELVTSIRRQVEPRLPVGLSLPKLETQTLARSGLRESG
jgi:hypothetical protein